MKRETKTATVTDITYTFSREEMVAALCEAHDLTLKPSDGTGAHAVVVTDTADKGLAICFRFERAAP